MRSLLDASTRAVGPTPNDIVETELVYTTRDGTALRAKLFQPKTRSTDKGSPLFVLFHGGAFSGGSPENEALVCRNLVRAVGAVCVAPTYRVAPQFVFPTAANDAWDALQWAASEANTTAWGADPTTGFVVGGTSAGGNLAAVVTHMARNHGLSPPLTGHYLAVPVLTTPAAVPDRYRPYYLAHEQNKSSPVMDAAAVHTMVDILYQADAADHTQFAVLGHPQGHAGLPPVFVQACGLDALRDDALIYERVLAHECGIQTRLAVYGGQPHGFYDLFPTLKASTRFRQDQVQGLAWLIGREADMSNVVTKLDPEDALNLDHTFSTRPVFF